MTGPRLGRAPAVLLVPAVVGVALLVVPLATLVLDTPWRTLPEHLGSEAVREALVITALSSGLTVIACMVLGTPLAWLLARTTRRPRKSTRASSQARGVPSAMQAITVSALLSAVITSASRTASEPR